MEKNIFQSKIGESIENGNVKLVDYVEDIHKYQYITEMGLIKTYPTKKLQERIESEYPGCGFHIYEIGEGMELVPIGLSDVKGNPHIADKIIVNGIDRSEEAKMKKICSVYGYTCIYSEMNDAYVIGPKFDNKYTASKDRMPKRIFHVTPDSNVKKIKEKGFCPYNKKDRANSHVSDYEPRIYFFS